jgi:hypothetical protein
LSAESVEAVELLHYWIGSGIVKDIRTRIAMEEMEEVEVNRFVEADNWMIIGGVGNDLDEIFVEFPYFR